MNKELVEKMTSILVSAELSGISNYETAEKLEAVASEHYGDKWTRVEEVKKMIAQAYNDGVSARDQAHHSWDVHDGKIEANAYAILRFDINDYISQPPQQ